MKLEILESDSQLWQWDTGQKLIVRDDGTCNEVHFCNASSTKALVLPIKTQNNLRVVDIPNILLQEASMLKAYLYHYDADGCETRFAYQFSVRPRPKPENYVYTETEVLNYSSLVSRIDQIERNGVSDQQIATAVEKYLEENPIDTGVQFETDNTLILKDGVLSVNTTDQMEQDNTLPMTSAGVYSTVGNIEVLLKTI